MVFVKILTEPRELDKNRKFCVFRNLIEFRQRLIRSFWFATLRHATPKINVIATAQSWFVGAVTAYISEMLHHFQWNFLGMCVVCVSKMFDWSYFFKLWLAYPRSCDYQHILRIKIQAKKGTVSTNIKNFSVLFCSCVCCILFTHNSIPRIMFDWFQFYLNAAC